MYCKECGGKLLKGDSYCTKCGKKITPVGIVESQKKGWGLWKVVAVLLVSVILTSVFWAVAIEKSDRSSYSARIISHLLETIGRQGAAWGKNDQMIDLIGTGLSDECLGTSGCTDEAISQITVLSAEIEKEREEIGNLWSETGISDDFVQYFSSLDITEKTKIQDVMRIYFPDETKDINTTGNQLL
ncbi:hypothetical protein A2415_01160 [candidate division WWE3 bacterium RIFOXYC1_FULL_39_7]|uniref:Zinc-ribbon domain-containing protein n=2 Tax=Katanobacteria TaxID=422282 RepID=A0A1F4X9H3_UNCKA|nr:MAG: hypothetical protein A2415_01160 [candidate division WWE3 bacterium RIFOXYC1_FULL_39_7]OGC78314.1 MAG: hypothetical protein A2619_04090 [candidate division WWE3 bacterium RIFOXYD1_FULL_39_9]